MAEPPWIIEWLDAFSMSNPEIDAEHRRFIKLVNELNTEIMSNRQDKAVIRELMGLILGRYHYQFFARRADFCRT